MAINVWYTCTMSKNRRANGLPAAVTVNRGNADGGSVTLAFDSAVITDAAQIRAAVNEMLAHIRFGNTDLGMH